MKANTFFKFIYYDWGDERNGDSVNINSGSKEWQIYKEVNDYKNANDSQRNLIKREFFNKHIEPDFASIVDCDGEDDTKEF